MSPEAWRGTLACYHAGYWQSRDKAHFRFLAGYLAPLGIDVALANYPLCPDVTRAILIEIARRSVPQILATARDLRVKLLDGVGLGVGAEIRAQAIIQDREQLQRWQATMDLSDKRPFDFGEVARERRIPEALCLGSRLAGTAGRNAAVCILIGGAAAATDSASLNWAKPRPG